MLAYMRVINAPYVISCAGRYASLGCIHTCVAYQRHTITGTPEHLYAVATSSRDDDGADDVCVCVMAICSGKLIHGR